MAMTEKNIKKFIVEYFEKNYAHGKEGDVIKITGQGHELTTFPDHLVNAVERTDIRNWIDSKIVLEDWETGETTTKSFISPEMSVALFGMDLIVNPCAEFNIYHCDNNWDYYNIPQDVFLYENEYIYTNQDHSDNCWNPVVFMWESEDRNVMKIKYLDGTRFLIKNLITD